MHLGSKVLGTHSRQVIFSFLRIQIEVEQRQNMPKGRLPSTPRKATYHLLVREHRTIVDQCHAVGCVAAFAHAGLGNAATVHLHSDCVGAHLALEEGFLHLRNQLRCPDYHATDGNELVDVCKGERSACPLATAHTQADGVSPRAGFLPWQV